jgi:hypothetical protein
MATKKEVYRFRDGVTPLDAAELNGRFFDIDARLGGVETKSIDWDVAFGILRDLGLSRLADLLGQLNQQAQDALAAQAATFTADETQRASTFTADEAQRAAALASWAQQINALVSGLNAAIAASENSSAALIAVQVWRDLLNPPHDGFVWADRLRDGPTAITYNTDGSIAHVDATLPGNHTYRQAYTYNQDGSVATAVGTLDAVTLWTRTYTYDQAGTLTGWTEV